jgi:DNA replication licensing factor MCM3
MNGQLVDEEHASRVRACTEFLDPTDQRARSYRADIVLMLNRGFRRLTVSIDEIRTHDRTIADGLLNSPFEYSTCFNQALKDVIQTLPDRPKKESAEEVVRRTKPS